MLCRSNAVLCLLLLTASVQTVACHLIFPFDVRSTGPADAASQDGSDGPADDVTRDDAVVPLDNGTDTVVDPLTPFGPPVPLPGTINTAEPEDDPSLTGDMLEIYFERKAQIFASTRSSVTESWPAAQPATKLNEIVAWGSHCPKISADGLEVYFSIYIDAALQEIYHSTRSSRGAPWSTPQEVAELNSAFDDACPMATADGKTLYFTSARSGGLGDDDLWFSTRDAVTSPWSAPQNLAVLNTTADDKNPWIDPIGAVVYFYSDRSGGAGANDIWVAVGPGDRSFGVVQPLDAQINTPDDDEDPWLSPDLRTLIFTRKINNDEASADIYMATR